jgi:hypothetical protein
LREQRRDLRIGKATNERLRPTNVGSTNFVGDLCDAGLLLEEGWIWQAQDAAFHEAVNGMVLFRVQIDAIRFAKLRKQHEGRQSVQMICCLDRASREIFDTRYRVLVLLF